MTDKMPPPPFTPEEIQEKLRSGKFRIECAPTSMIETYAKECDELVLILGKCMSNDLENWAAHCFISDQSTLSDFLSCENADYSVLVENISQELGFKVAPEMYMYEIAMRMRGLQ